MKLPSIGATFFGGKLLLLPNMDTERVAGPRPDPIFAELTEMKPEEFARRLPVKPVLSPIALLLMLPSYEEFW